ncbi:sensor histidine kinase [Kurthia sibirica]|uniref:histidine kinase n=1 Tax=Kurthia sibirica TaxID=202750 RepID=A0A2U3AJ38_9BACL|nr:ATP-binding protein [Kurthia sibirica]PWI24527.1 hypothetical protein DEX24_13120 [Kurthia sibirica]GEK33596.1 serine/threonine protein kinase [Kurthia sibirica]
MNSNQYKQLKTLASHSDWSFHIVFCKKRQRKLFMKKGPSTNITSLKKLYYEVNSTSTIDSNWLLQPLAIEEYKTSHCILYEFFEAVTLDIFAQNKLSLSQFKKFSLSIVNAFIGFEMQHQTYQSISSKTILINPKNYQGAFIAYDSLTSIYDETNLIKTPSKNTELLKYYSPEQTRQTNQVIDYRSDLYSLGVLFYEILTSEMPFKGDNSRDLLFDILTKQAPPLSDSRPDLPYMLSAMIAKLLKKDKNDRYQSAQGLKYDLEKLFKNIEVGRDTEKFPLALNDSGLTSTLNQQLIGRTTEIKQLQKILTKASHGDPQLLYVEGAAGVGKSSYIRELLWNTSVLHGYFITTKIEKSKFALENSLLVSSIRQLLKQLYTDTEHLVKWQSLFKHADLTLSSVLMDNIPEIAWFLDAQLPKQNFSFHSKKTKNLFHSDISKILQLFEKEHYPIILFFDDIHWASTLAVEDLIDFYSNYNIGNICIILSCRPDEYSNASQLQRTIQELPNGSTITLQSLPYSDIMSWVRLSIHMTDESYIQLVNQLYSLAKGNPFHTQNIFLAMIQNNVLNYSLTQKTWQFDSKNLSSLHFSDDILDLLTEKIKSLPPDCLKVLNIISYFGHSFSLNKLLYVSKMDFSIVHVILKTLIQEGYLIPLNNNFKYAETLYELKIDDFEDISFQFVHDHVLHTAQNLLCETEQFLWHYKIGQYYFYTKNLEKLDHLEKITYHWNLSKTALSPDEQSLLCNWNYKLSEKAIYIGLFNLSYQYIIACFSLLPARHWENDSLISFKVYLMRGYVEGILFDVETAMFFLDEALENTNELDYKLHVYFIKTRIYLDRDDVYKSIDIGLQALHLASVLVPSEPTKPQLAMEYFKTKYALSKNKKRDLAALPLASNSVITTLLEIMIDLVSAGFIVNKQLATFLILRSVRLVLKYGKTDVDSIIWNNYSLILIAGFNEFEAGIQFNSLALLEVEKTKDIKSRANIHLTIGSFINHWTKSFDTNIQHLRKSQKYAKELSINHMLAGASSFIVSIQLLNGSPLNVVKEEIKQQQLFLQATPMSLSTNYLNEVIYWVECLQDCYFEIDWHHKKINLTEDTITYMHFSLRQLMGYLLKKQEQLATYLIACHNLENNVMILPVMPHTLFIQSLSLYDMLLQAEQTTIMPKKDAQIILNNNLKKFKVWASLQQANFEHMYVLLQAQQLRLQKKYSDSLLYFDRAIQLSRQYQHLQDEAICCERAASYCVASGSHDSAQSYMKQAIEALERWGAHHIILEWKKHYSFLFENMMLPSPQVIESTNLPIIEEAIKLFSEEATIEAILKQTLSLLMRTVGATSCDWHQYDDQNLGFTATLQRNSRFICMDYSPVERRSNTLLNYVINSQESLIINNTDEKKNSHAYSTARSTYYIPILHNKKITAILCFENTQSSFAFNTSYNQIITIISRQIIAQISQINTVTNLESIVEKRTDTLMQLNNDLLESNQKLEYSKNNLQNLFQLISHDLRSPLTSVVGFIDLLLDGIIHDPQQINQYLVRSKEKLFSMNQMIQDLFDLSKLQAGSLKVNFETWSAQNLFFDLNSRLLFDVNQTHLNYSSEMKLDSDILLSIDLQRIEQVLMNLIQNAVKHTKEGSIDFSMIKREAYIDFIIKDTGNGIDPQHIPFIFDINYTKSSSLSTESSGIGLAICKQIIENHNGQFFVESTQNVGSIFTFSIPYIIQ